MKKRVIGIIAGTGILISTFIYIVSGADNSIYIDPTYTGVSTGTINQPLKTLPKLI